MKNGVLDENKIAFVDSGVGGLIFGIDTIIEMSLNYDISKLSFVHIGDTANMPYGIKTTQELSTTLTNLIHKAISYNAKTIVIACNTACTIMDDKFLKQFDTYNVNIVTIIKGTARYIYNKTPTLNNTKHIGILGTMQTIKSQEYERALITEHNNQKSNVNLKIETYSPVTWEEDIENNIPKDKIYNEVSQQMTKFKNKIGDENFNNIQTLGLCCTHYPYFYNEILTFFKNNSKQLDIKIISQGMIFAKILGDSLNLLKLNNLKQKIKISSYLTGNDCLKTQHIINNMYQNIELSVDKYK